MSEELKTVETMDREPFKYMVATIGNLPTSFVDSMSYYECLAWLCNYIQKTVIPTVNNNAEAVEELQAKWIELKAFCDEYFTNLNVQNEINNKLDAMADSGELAEIINQEIFSELDGKVDDNTAAIAELQGDLSDLETELLHSRAIVKDSEYDTIEEAFSDCLTNDYVLYLTTNHQLGTDGVEFPNIIGNGYTITLMNTDSSTIIENSVNNKTISDVKFVANSTYARYFFYNVNDGIIEKCEFSGFLQPMRVVGINNTIIKDCVMKNCSEGVYVKNASNVLIDNITLINTIAQKTAIVNLLSSTAGQDAVLIEGSKNVKVVNSYFEYCIERTLYSSDSDDVIFSNNIISNSDGVKFCGYTDIRKGFVCEGNLLRNAFGDAFCQLYECDSCEVNNNIVTNDTDSNKIGWFIRAGHNLTNISVKGNYARRIHRCWLHYEDVFPETVLTNHYVFSYIDIENNIGIDMMMINNPIYGAIHYTKTNTTDTHTGVLISIKNNTFYSAQSQGDSSFDNRTCTFSHALVLSDARKVVCENNDIRGISENNLSVPAMSLTDCSDVNINETYYLDKSLGALTLNNPSGIVAGQMTLIGCGADHQDRIDLNISNKGLMTGTFSSACVNKQFYMGVPKSWDLNLECLNVDEISRLWSISGTTYSSGDRASTTNSTTSNVVCFYEDTSTNVLRCRTTRNLAITGTLTVFF